MTYEGHDWQNDEVITANLLNAMEDAIEKGNSDGITSVTVNTLNAGESATASVSGGVLTLGIPKGDPGAQGPKGADGKTPTIGTNGNWFIGSEDTGKPSRGATGATGAPGAAGPAGPAGPKGETGLQGQQGLTGPAGPKGDTGAAGAAGLGVKTITLTTDSTGNVTSGKWTDTADGQHDIIVRTAGA
jgi:hypothetical protein